MHRKLGLTSFLIVSMGSSFAFAEQYEKGKWNLLTEFVYMRRAEGKDHILVLDSSKKECRNGCLSSRSLDTGNLVNDFGFDPGFRVGLAYLQDFKSTYEANFLYITEWEAEKSRHAHGKLSYPFHDSSFSHNFSGADKAVAKYTSFFCTFDLNYWRHFSRRQKDYFAVSGMFGIRYAHLNEYFKLTFYDERTEGDYKSSTQNDLIGVQAGGSFQINPNPRFNWNLQGMAGIGLNRASNNVFLGDMDNSIILRDFKRQKWQSVVFADAATGFGYQISDWANFHIGYEVLYFSGLALAPDQLSHSTSPGMTHIATKGYIVIHGLFTGFTFTF